MRCAALMFVTFWTLDLPTKMRAQNPDGAMTARATVDSFFGATHEERWTDAVTYLELSVFERFFRQRVNQARVTLPQPALTVEELMSRDSTMPRAVAEWQIKSWQSSLPRPAFGDFSHEFAGITSFRALQALTPAEAAARWLEAQDPLGAYRRVAADANCPQPVPDSIRIRIREAHRPRTIGTILMDDSTAFVLVADRYVAEEENQLHAPSTTALKVRRRAHVWRLMPNNRILRRDGFIVIGPSCGRR